MAKRFVCLVLILCAICVTTNSLDLPTLISGTRLQINGQKIIIHCKFNSIINVVPPWTASTKFQEIYLNDCVLPPKPVVEVLETLNISPHINKLLYEYLYVDDKIGDIGPLKAANYMENLTIETIEIASKNKDMLLENPEFFNPLSNLKNLIIKGIELPSIPKSLSLETIALENAKIKHWNNCTNLKKLYLKRINEHQIPERWPTNCTRLVSFHVEELNVEALKNLITEMESPNLKNFTIKSSQLKVLPHRILEAAKDLTHLDLRGNNLVDKKFTRFPVLQNLTSLDLSNNNLTGWFLVDVATKLPSLRTLTLDGNKFYHSFRYFQMRIAITQLPSLQRLSMAGMLMDPDCLMSVQFSNLEYLNLASSEPIATLLLNSLPTTNATRLEVDLRGRPVRSVPVDLKDYQNIHNQKKRTNLTVHLSYIDCDCNNADLAKLLKDHPNQISLPDLRCNRESGKPFLLEPTHNLNCKKEKIHDCIKRSWDFNTMVDCSNLMKYQLQWSDMTEYGIRGINASGNRITSLIDVDFEWLQWIDLRNNRLSRLGKPELAQLFAVRSRKVWLGGNMFICDCENRALMRALHAYSDQVMDYEDIFCVDKGEYLKEISVFEVCRIGRSLVWATCCVGSSTTVMIMVVIRRWGGFLRTIMFSRGYCLSLLSEKDPDADRPYDAFISFAHGDDSFVMDQLLPRLELNPAPFRVCVHYRDWVVGDWIPAQIMRSVRFSKRTIIILSKHLIASWWGVLEFRYAHAQAMAEGRSRLLVLVLDDVLDQKLEAELQGYLSTNTFLKYDDPWFWDKLHYALSHNTIRYHSWWESKYKGKFN